MIKYIFPFSGKGWLRASFIKMQNSLILALLQRFFPIVPVFTLRSLSGLPEHQLMINGDGCLVQNGHSPALLYESGGITLQSKDFCMHTGSCRCSAYEDFSFECNTLTSFPIWRNN